MADGEVLGVLRALEVGRVCRGVVRSIERFGVFVDVGGVVGLVSVAELAWRRFGDASEVVRVGQEVVVEVLDVDLDRERVSLSLKALQPDPLVEVARSRLGDVVTGPVTKVVPFGVFVEVDDGVEGLVHASEFADGVLPGEGRELRVRIADINLRSRRVRLTLV
ncbi:S1 RNA-binding domain-containing protein [Actinomadura fibrosa]|uniref:S1 RNA-binding domain-containing protein n=1 Tax=Actinomadura fibrosa TaxID=111802 RepID=A0ABW2XUQ1_9ACTN|nr:S1 RNA-binding domain-containing protein [Actinomadura fibrosa]